MSNLKPYKLIYKLESADILALNSTFKTILDPGVDSGGILLIGNPVIHFIDTGTNYSGGSTIALRCGSGGDPYTVPKEAIIGGGDKISVFSISTGTLDMHDSVIYIYCTGSGFTTGVGHAYIIFYYAILEL